MLLRRLPATLAAHRPDWVLCPLGGNDVTRIGPEPARPQVAPSGTIANLQRMRALAPQPHWLWLTPVPVREDRIAANPAFRFGSSTWRNDDIRALAEAMHRLDGPPRRPARHLRGPRRPHPAGRGRSAPQHGRTGRNHRSLVERLTNR
jgi:acyl-CoA thioesterase-1